VEHHRILANGTAHHYVTAGEGPPLVLLHGFPQTWAEWRPVIERLSGRFRIIAPDLRGLGGVPGPVDGYDKHTLATDIRAIVAAECGDQPVALCGHDLGGYVAFAYALQYRAGVTSLVIVDAPPPGTTYMDQLRSHPRTWHIAFHANVDVPHMLITGREREYISQFVASRIYNAGAITPADIDLYAAAYRAPGALRAALEMYRSLALDRELNLAALQTGGKLEMPVVFAINSSKTDGVPLESVIDEIATSGHVVVVDKSGHWIPEEQPDKMAEIITEASRRGYHAGSRIA
jgi:pimeloyl-ACP methyl ester carboxylesterase